MAAHVLTEIAGFATTPLPVTSTRKAMEHLHRDLIKIDKQQYGETHRVLVSRLDVSYCFEEVFNARSAVSGEVQWLLLTKWIMSGEAVVFFALI